MTGLKLILRLSSNTNVSKKLEIANKKLKS